MVRFGGKDRYQTAERVAASGLFPSPVAAGLARGDEFPDALAGGAHVGRLGGPVLLTQQSSLSPEARDWLAANKSTISRSYLYGGTSAVSEGVRGEAPQAVR